MMISVAMVPHKECEPCLLSFLPTNEFFYIVHDLKPGYSDSVECLLGPFLKVCFVTKYGICNALNFATGEIMELDEHETLVRRFGVPKTVVFEEIGL